jgi:AraC-like DNA-binding protein
LGQQRAHELLLLYSTVIQELSRTHGGNEVYRREQGFVMSFSSHTQALDCALMIRKKLHSTAGSMGLRMAVHAGVPVDKDSEIFGSTIRFGQFLCNIGKADPIKITADVNDLFKNNDWKLNIENKDLLRLNAFEQTFLQTILNTLNSSWHNADFDMLDFCKVMSVSKSQLYRKCTTITGISPNALLREYRLLRSLDLLREADRNISQITFDTGFSSPSYFIKCFQKRFGISPLTYLKARPS